MERRNYREGPDHYAWKGDDVGYFAAHHRVRRIRGKAISCVWGCESAQYTWANLTGNYADPQDYASMCQSCHMRFDNARRSMEPGFTRQPAGARSRLSEQDKREMRILCRAGLSQVLIGRIYRVSSSRAGEVVKGLSPRRGRWA